jgi:hypothetical protein
VAGSCEHVNGRSGSVKGGEYLDQQNYYSLLREDCAPRRQLLRLEMVDKRGALKSNTESYNETNKILYMLTYQPSRLVIWAYISFKARASRHKPKTHP